MAKWRRTKKVSLFPRPSLHPTLAPLTEVATPRRTSARRICASSACFNKKYVSIKQKEHNENRPSTSSRNRSHCYALVVVVNNSFRPAARSAAAATAATAASIKQAGQAGHLFPRELKAVVRLPVLAHSRDLFFRRGQKGRARD